MVFHADKPFLYAGANAIVQFPLPKGWAVTEVKPRVGEIQTGCHGKVCGLGA